MRNMTRNLMLAAGCLLAVGGSQANVPEVLVSGIQTEVAAGDIVSRSEAVIKAPMLHMDGYLLAEHQDNHWLLMARGQYFPVRRGAVSLGGAVQETYRSGGRGHLSYGPSLRVSGHPWHGAYGKIDTRYLMPDGMLDEYGILDTPGVFADVLWKANLSTGSVMIRPGIDVKVATHLRAGIEARLSGQADDLHTDYVGGRFTATF